MTRAYRLTGFLLLAALLRGTVSGYVGTLASERRATKSTRLLQGLMGGGALLFWALLAVSASGFTLGNPVELSVLMSPRIFTGGFFVAPSTFPYAFLGGLLLGPVSGTLVNRAVRASEDAGAGRKEDLVVR